MNILAINGSPRRRGGGARIIQAMLQAPARAGLKIEVVNLYEKRISGCLACEYCKSKSEVACAIKDDMAELYPKIIQAEAVIISTPIYMGHISGPLKCFLDRFYAFVDSKFQPRYLPGKKLAIVVTSGAAAGVYAGVARYLRRWLGDFMKMAPVGTIQAGGLGSNSEVDPRIITRAQRIGRALVALNDSGHNTKTSRIYQR